MHSTSMSLKLQRLFVASFIALFFMWSVRSVSALEAPSFPSCESPQGEVRASYAEGVHGIAGNSGEFRGSDTVYTVSGNQVLQCFCPASSDGIQTNWWKVENISETEKDSFIRQGWIYIPNGALWGLDPAPYLAKNEAFFCGDRGGGSSSSSSNSSGSSTSSSGEVLGLAATGRSATRLAAFTGLGMLLVGSYLVASRKKKLHN